MCIRDSRHPLLLGGEVCSRLRVLTGESDQAQLTRGIAVLDVDPVSYTHLRAHETVLDLVCRLLLEKKKSDFIVNHLHE